MIALIKMANWVDESYLSDYQIRAGLLTKLSSLHPSTTPPTIDYSRNIVEVIGSLSVFYIGLLL